MKRIIGLLSASVMVISLFAGCGTTSNTQTSVSTVTATAEQVASATQEPVKDVTVNILHHMGETIKQDGLKLLTDAVTAKSPNIKFNAQGVDQNQFATTLKTKIAAGDPPDLISDRPKKFAEVVSAGNIMDLTGQAFLDNVSETAASSMMIDGKVYGVAIDLGTMGVFYNKDIFKQAGVEIPKTYSDFIKLCDTLVSKNIVPMAHGFKDAWTAQVDFDSDFNGLPQQKNPTIFKDILAKTKKFSDFPDFKASLIRYAKRISYRSGNDFGTDYGKAQEMFSSGKAAMFIDGNWGLGAIRKQNPNGNFGFFVNPQSDNVDENILNISVDDAWMVGANTKVKDAVYKFLDYATTPEGTSDWTKATGTISVMKGATSENIDPMVADILSYMDSGKTFNGESIDIFSGQHDATFRKFQEIFAADSKRDVDKYIEKLDKDFEAMK